MATRAAQHEGRATFALLERESQLEILRGALADSRHRDDVVLVVVRGGPGSGKSSLLAAFGDESRRAGVLVATNPDPDGATTPLLMPGQPAVLITDDAHAAGPAALRALAEAAVAREGGLLVVLALDPGPGGRAGEVPAAVRVRDRRELALPPLSPAAVAVLLARAGDGRDLGPATVAEVHERTGGNPLLAAAAAHEHALVHREPGARRHQGRAVREVGAHAVAVAEWLDRCDPLLRRAAEVIATIGDAQNPRLVARVGVLEPHLVGDLLQALAVGGLLAGARMRDPRTTRVIQEAMPVVARRRLHAAAAVALRESDAAAEDVARHVLASGSCPAWTRPVLKAAAERALAGDRVADAMRYLVFTGADGLRPAERAPLIGALVRAQFRRDPVAAAARWPRDLTPDEERDGADDSADAAAVLRARLWSGHACPSGRWREDDPTSAAAAEARLARLWVHGPGTHPPTPGAGPWGMAASVLTQALRGNHSQGVVDGAEQVLHECRLGDGTLEVLTAAIQALVLSGCTEQAATWCERLLQEAGSRVAPTWTAVFSALRADIALRHGQVDTAREQARDALAQLPRAAWGVVIGLPLATLLTVATLTGRHSEAARLLRPGVPGATFRTMFGLPLLLARGHHHLAAGRAVAAERDFLTCGALAAEVGADVPSAVPWRSAAARAHIARGRADLAEPLLAQELRLPGAGLAQVRGSALRVLATAVQPRRRVALLQEASLVLRGSADRLALAGVLADLCRAHHDLGEHRRAEEIAQRALLVARACGAEALCVGWLPATVARDEPVATPGDGEALSASEGRVASLAALGRTNKEIAQALHVTVSTVEQHLTRIYRKMQVRNRGELAGCLLSAVPAGPRPL